MTQPTGMALSKGVLPPTPVPSSTYRLQITSEFTLYDAARIVPYLHRLGAGWVYCSPLLAAEPGSDHGYDVIDHSRTDPERGGREGLAALADAAHAHGMGVLVDIVPNHVGIASPPLSVWWRDVLALGAASPHAAAFDIDWSVNDGKITVPVLGDGPDELAALSVDRDGDVGFLRYYEHAFPLAPGSAPPGDSPALVHDRQHYRLVNFRLADTDLNYRRFFAVSTLAGIRVERPETFAESHREIRHWIEAGWVDGLRVDHPDGLADPLGYLDMLAELSAGRYTLVEKILEPGEELPRDWSCAGTTGYDALALIDRVLIDPAGEPTLTELDAKLRATRSARREKPASWPALVHDTKRAVAEGILGSEVRRLVRLLPPSADGEAAGPRRIDAVAELLANFAVYRTYAPETDPELPAALARARAHRPDLAAEFDVIERAARDAGSEFAIRLQQTSGSVMAKGVEDCAFYRFPRLTSLTEVGGDPSVFSASPAEFHASNAHRLGTWPRTMTTLSTHDTKRGEDVRARIDALAEVADEWAAAVTEWVARLAFPDPVLANLVLQTAVGAWPVEADRLHGYAEKAAREAGDSTGWIDPNPAFEEELHRLVDSCYEGGVIHAELDAFADRNRAAGWSNSLAAKLHQLTMPGVPDVYRGTELWSNDMVDPDNRRPFDALAGGGAADMLARLDEGWLPPVDATGAVKLLVTSAALRARRDRPELFTGYQLLAASGPEADHVLAFDRGGAVTVATRLPIGLARRGGFTDTGLQLPHGEWRDALTGSSFRVADRGSGGVISGGAARVADVLSRYPVALLLAE
jgi:(1->4)-alpha-D-glucan 1-alpha-D-glucosylmutase